MNNKKIQKYLSWTIKVCFVILGLLFALSVVELEMNKKSPEEIAKILEETKKMRQIMASGGRINDNLPDPWPPKMNNTYPDIEFFDQSGQEFSMESLKGKVIILEFIDISSPISQAQSGAGLLGAYYASSTKEVDKYAEPFSDLLRADFGQAITFPNDSIIELKVIVYGEGGAAASRDDAQNWAGHFALLRSDNVIVAAPKKDIRGKESDALIAGFQLIDRNMLLRVDSAGPEPKHNLKMTLIPLVPKLIR